jgi:hypothetical protein
MHIAKVNAHTHFYIYSYSVCCWGIALGTKNACIMSLRASAYDAIYTIILPKMKLIQWYTPECYMKEIHLIP